MKQLLVQPSSRALVWATRGGFSTVQTLLATLVCFASPPIASAQTNRQLTRNVQQTQPADAVHFAKSSDCALCHSFSDSASAMRDGKNRNIAPFDLWSGSMMANSAVDPYWKAAVSAEVAATPSQKPHIEEVCSRCHAPMAAPITTSPNAEVLAFLCADHAKAALSKDGVSCTVCHQISSENLGTDASFTGGFQFNKKSEIYGPHANPVTMPMQRHIGFTPTKADHILSSAMCATCHTVITESFDKQGTATHAHLHEQVPYSSGVTPASMTKSIRIKLRPEVARAAMCPDRYRWQCDLRQTGPQPWRTRFPVPESTRTLWSSHLRRWQRLHDAVAARQSSVA